MVGGSVFHKTRKSLAEFGRLVVFGVASGEQVKFYPTSLMGKNQAVIGFFLPQIMKRTELYKKGMEDLLSYVDSGKIKLTIGGTYSLDEAKKVHQLFRSEEHTSELQSRGHLVCR